MPVFRVEKTRDYTVMANHHLKDRRLSLRAKGLLSVMLSLPEEWDYTLKGLSVISKEGVDAIGEAVKELERAGYIIRSRQRDDHGRLRGMECTASTAAGLGLACPVLLLACGSAVEVVVS